MKFNIEEDNEKSDYFDGPDIPAEEPKPEKPEFEPDDPRYWEQPESEFEHLKPPRTGALRLWIAGGFALILLLILVYFRYFSPYIEEATQYGYVEKIDREGHIFKTYEGVLLPYKSLMDTTRVYEGDFRFATPSGELATKLRRMQYGNLPVRVVYKVYHARVPWRGNSRIILERVDSVDPTLILPPDRRPEIHR